LDIRFSAATYKMHASYHLFPHTIFARIFMLHSMYAAIPYVP